MAQGFRVYILNILKGWLWLWDKELYMKIIFFRSNNYWPDVKSPQTINENILKLKISSPESYSRYADKLKVRSFIEAAISGYGLTNLRLPDIPIIAFDLNESLTALKGKEVFIKGNHGSGMCIYFDGTKRSCLSTTEFSLINSWFNNNYYKFTGERCYKNITKKIFAETVLRTASGELPDDIKVHCYFGKPAVIQVIRRTSGVLERKTYDSMWRPQAWFHNEVLSVDLKSIPQNEVLQNAIALSQKFDYVRVDFYLVDNCLYFSELTFYPASACLPLISKQVDMFLGQKFNNMRPV
jgi:hypothetical protein